MTLIPTKNEFHVALDGVGMILKGAPDRLAYSTQQAPTYGQRFASGDRDYNDLSKWWYFYQTDWSGGNKDETSWDNDAKYYYANNIDAYSEPGTIKLAKKQLLQNTFTENVICGHEGMVGGVSSMFIGTDDNVSGKPVVYQYTGTWVDISSLQMTSNQNAISQLLTRNGYLWVASIGNGMTNVLLYWNGSTWTDCAVISSSAISWQFSAARCMVTIGSKHYVFVDNYLNKEWALVSCTKDNPTLAADWTKVLERTNTTGNPVACAEFGGDLYYLVSYGNYADLRVYDTVAATDTSVRIFKNCSFQNWGCGDKYLVVSNNKLVITIPPYEVWTFDGSSLERIYKRDNAKALINSNSMGWNNYANLGYGAVVSDNKVWWGKMMWDGDFMFWWVLDAADDSNFPVVLFVPTNGQIWMSDSLSNKKVYAYSHIGSDYKGQNSGKNFIIFNNIDNLAGIDKLAYSLTLLFKTLGNNQVITIKYLTGELASNPSWVTLGTVTTADGSVTDKKFIFPSGTIFKKMWLRIEMDGDGTSTPTITDVVSEYLPVPTQSKLWNLSIDCGDEVRRLNGRLVQKTGRELKSMLEKAWWTKSTLDFQDFDYATTTLNGALNSSATTITVGSTIDFPEQGRIVIDDEQIFYSGKTSTTFTGCTRGARDSRATAHSNGAVINNANKVIVTNLRERIPIMLEGKNLEYIVELELREV